MSTELAAARRAAAFRAVELVEPGMVVGLGTGDTAGHAVRALGARARAGLAIVGVPTSRATAELATAAGVPLVEPDAVATLDLTIDGADEFDDALRMIKGAGGALTRERLVARASQRVVIVVDHEKRVPRLGARRRLPVEIVAFGARWTIARLAALGLEPVLRVEEAGPVVTDGGGHLVDCLVREGVDVVGLAGTIKAVDGVVEHGLFLDEASVVLVGWPERVEELSRA